MKKTTQETKKKYNILKEDRHRLDMAVTPACGNFIDEGITPEMFSKDKVFRLGEVPENLCKRVA